MAERHIAYFHGKTVAILGYDHNVEDQGHVLQEHGVRVLIGLRQEDPLAARARQAGFEVVSLWGAVEQADIIQVWSGEFVDDE